MKSALEQCIERKADRFVVRDSGEVFLEHRVNGGLEQIDADAACYLAAVAQLAYLEPTMVDNLVSAHLQIHWRLSVQREDGYSVWTPYSQKLPTLAD